MTTQEDGIGRAAEEISDHQGIFGSVVHKDRCKGVLGRDELTQEFHILKVSFERKKLFILHGGHVTHGTRGSQHRFQGLHSLFMDGNGVVPGRIRVRSHLGNEEIKTSIKARCREKNKGDYEARFLVCVLFCVHSILTLVRLYKLVSRLRSRARKEHSRAGCSGEPVY